MRVEFIVRITCFQMIVRNTCIFCEILLIYLFIHIHKPGINLKFHMKIEPISDYTVPITPSTLNPDVSRLPVAEPSYSKQRDVSFYTKNKDKNDLPFSENIFKEKSANQPFNENMYEDTTSSNLYGMIFSIWWNHFT